MDKQRDQVSNNPGARDVPFSNSMMDDNEPDDGEANAGANDNRLGQMGARNSTRSDGDAGSTTCRTLPPPSDPHAGSVSGGNNQSIAQYGLKE